MKKAMHWKVCDRVSVITTSQKSDIKCYMETVGSENMDLQMNKRNTEVIVI